MAVTARQNRESNTPSHPNMTPPVVRLNQQQHLFKKTIFFLYFLKSVLSPNKILSSARPPLLTRPDTHLIQYQNNLCVKLEMFFEKILLFSIYL